MLNVHDAPASTDLHVDPLIENSPALLLLIAVTATEASPSLLTVTVLGELAEPSITLGKLRLVGNVSLPNGVGGGGETPASLMPNMGTVSEPPPKLQMSDPLS